MPWPQLQAIRNLPINLELIKLYDHYCPEQHFDEYCEYYKMKKKDFLKNIDKWANKKLFEKKKGKWTPIFKVI